MKIQEIQLKNFKRFTDLTITNIPSTAKLIIIVGPNGSGKTSLFDAMYAWYRYKSSVGLNEDNLYYRKYNIENNSIYNNINIKFHDTISNQPEFMKKSMYFRTAYRNDPDFQISSLSQMPTPYGPRFSRLIDNDQAVSKNYERLISLTLSGIYNETNDQKTIKTLREELIGTIRKSMKNVFDDLVLNNIGDPLNGGTFHFEKGKVNSFHYKNLSGGEKSAFDLILDIVMKREYYPDAVYCIDEPEIHMHTKLQAKLINELYTIVPDQGQLWINTHSFGMMRKAREIMQDNPNSVVFIDFDGVDFDDTCVIKPVSVDRAVWEKFLHITIDDLAYMIKPKKVFLCEGSLNGNKRKNFDADCYSLIFSKKYTDVAFVSAESCNDIKKEDCLAYKLLKQVLPNSIITRVIDRDDSSPQEIQEYKKMGIKVLNKRHIESYLFDDEILRKLCLTRNAVPDSEQKVIDAKKEKIQNSINRGNPHDDIKSASGELYVEIKRLLNLTQCGNTVEAFMRDTLVPLITEETSVYKELETEILGDS